MISVSITDFRDNLAEYLRLAKYKSESVRIVDEKIGEPMAELNPLRETGVKKKDSEYMAFVKSMYGAFRDAPKDENRRALRKADRATIKKRLKR